MAGESVWKWNQDGTLSIDLSRATPSTLIPEVLRLADNLSGIIEAMDPDAGGGKVIGDRKRSLATALHKLNILGAAAVLPLYHETWREDRGPGLAVSTSMPSFEHDELARALIAMCMTPLGAYGHNQILDSERVTPEQIGKLERNKRLVEHLSRRFENSGAILEDVPPASHTLQGDSPPKKPVTLAGLSLEWVERERPDLAERYQTIAELRDAQYGYIKDSGECPAYPERIPSLDTWQRYIRDYLRQKDGPAQGIAKPETRSTARAKDLPNR